MPDPVKKLNQTTNTPPLRVNLLGPIGISTAAGEPIEMPRKVRALFAYLLTRRGTTVPRQTLLGLFWGERGEEQARSSLRQALNILRSALDMAADNVLATTGESVSVRDGSVVTDLDDLEELFSADSGEEDDTLAASTGFEFLEGLAIGEAGFEEWLAAERERVRTRLVSQLKQLAAMNEAARAYDRAASLTAYRLRLTPLDEEAHRQMMRLHMARSRTDAAIGQFEKCRTVLRQHLDVQPEGETIALWEQAKRQRRELSTKSVREGAELGEWAPYMASFTCPQQARPIVKSVFSSHGGHLVDKASVQPFHVFTDPSEALRACMEARAKLRESGAGQGVNTAFALHAGEKTEPDGAFGPADEASLANLLEATPANEIHVTSRFFLAIRRNSPCFFDDLSKMGNGELSGRYRAGRPMHRQPFMAVYTNEAPRQEKRSCSLAVAPIKNVGGEGESTDFYAEGLTEDLILELSRTKRIEVSSRTTLFAIKTHDAVEIGRELGVGYVLSGSFRKMGNAARLNFSLAETDKGNVVWSERFNAEFDGIFEVLDDIVAKVVARIAGKIEKSEIEAARFKRPENMTAYEYYLRGIWHHRMGGVTSEHSRKAVKWLTKAREADPSFYRPQAMLVCAWSDLPDYDAERADEAATKAYEADPTDPELNRIMAWVKLTRGEFDSAIRHAELSTELAPHDAYLLGRCAVMHIFNGDPETGLARLEKAVELDPFVPVYIVEEFLTAHYAMGDYEKVIAEARKLNHQTRRSRYYTAASLIALNRTKAARKLIRDVLEDDPQLSAAYVRGQELYRDKKLMQTLLDRLSEAGLPG